MMLQNGYRQIALDFGGGASVPFVFREDSVGDKGVIKQVFVDRDYNLSRLARFADITLEYQRIVDSGRTPLIVDCGANIGASPIWFSRLFPEARVFAIEPEEHNYELLNLNCLNFQNITCKHAAISCVDETTYLDDPGRGDWGFQTSSTRSAQSIAISAYSIESIAKLFPAAELLLVKIDIEGGEARLFEQNLAWVERTMVVVAELHDWMLPGTANSQNCLKALSRLNRDFVFIGENLYSIRNH